MSRNPHHQRPSEIMRFFGSFMVFLVFALSAVLVLFVVLALLASFLGASL